MKVPVPGGEMHPMIPKPTQLKRAGAGQVVTLTYELRFPPQLAHLSFINCLLRINGNDERRQALGVPCPYLAESAPCVDSAS